MRMEKEEIIIKIIAYIVSGLLAAACVIPFWLIIMGSITAESEIYKTGYSFWPHKISFIAYTSILKNPATILKAYGVTIFITVVGTFISLMLTAMGAYALSRKDFAWRNKIAYFIYFTTLFNGGLTPWYILMCSIGMRNNIVSLILPHLFQVFHILIFRNFINSIPFELTESAKIDGANDIKIFFRIIRPLIKPAMATIGLFTALTYWNEWYNAMLFITNKNLYPLQYFLYDLINNTEALKNMSQSGVAIDTADLMPSETVKLAMTVIVTGPIVVVYPFVQKYFVKGLVVGAVKG